MGWGLCLCVSLLYEGLTKVHCLKLMMHAVAALQAPAQNNILRFGCSGMVPKVRRFKLLGQHFRLVLRPLSPHCRLQPDNTYDLPKVQIHHI